MEKEKLQELIAKGLTQREMALELDKSQTSIRHWLIKFELKTHNDKKPREKKPLCKKCGVNDVNLFYGNDKRVCGKCHNERVKLSAKTKREYAVGKLGGACKNCTYNLYMCSLDIHHLDPSKKDKNFKSMRGWSIDRIDREIEGCVLLCKNCHSAYHNGDIKLNGAWDC